MKKFILFIVAFLSFSFVAEAQLYHGAKKLKKLNQIGQLNMADSLIIYNAGVRIVNGVKVQSTLEITTLVTSGITTTGRIMATVATEQLRLRFDTSNYATWTVAADGALTIATVDAAAAEGDINLNPDGFVGILTAVPTVELDVTGAIKSSGAITAGGAFTSPGIDDNADATAITIDVTTEKVNFSAAADVVGAFTAGSVTSDAGVTATTQLAGATFFLDITQDYLFTEDGNSIAIQSQTNDTPSNISLFSKKGDLGDNITMNFFGLGTPGSIANRERLIFGFVAATPRFEMKTDIAGSGVAREFALFTAGNTDQLVLETDGSISFGFETVYVPNAASNSGTSVADDGAITVLNTIMRMVGADADALLDTDPAVNDGIADGQIVIIQGTADGNTVTIADNVNTQLAGGANMTLGDGDVLCLMWDSNYSMWIEQYRADN